MLSCNVLLWELKTGVGGGEDGPLPLVVTTPAPHLVVVVLWLWLQGRRQGWGLQGRITSEPGPWHPNTLQPLTFAPLSFPDCEALGEGYNLPAPQCPLLRNGHEGTPS